MGDVLNDPEELALLLVQQYLDERGFTQALSEVEKASGVKYYPARAATGSMLLDVSFLQHVYFVRKLLQVPGLPGLTPPSLRHSDTGA